MRNSLIQFLLGLVSSVCLAQEFPPSWKFVVLKSPHFDVIVDAEQQELGRFYAMKLEKAYSAVTPLFTSVPARIPVVIADKTDSTNGYATRMPYSHIFIYPVLPGPQESLSEGGDWAFELVAHEYTHILTFEAVSGYAKPLSSVFGTILSPNLLLPLWWKEGVAVQAETAVSNGGRLRSVYQDGMLRSFERAGTLASFDIAQINEVLPDWPQGQRPYLFGSLFWSQAVAEKGPQVVNQLFQRHGGRLPYFINGPAEDLLGTSYEDFYNHTLRETSQRAERQIEELSALAFTTATPLPLNAKASFGPKISPDGLKMALIAVNRVGRRSLRVLQRNSRADSFVLAKQIESFTNRHETESQPATKDGPPAGSISRLNWLDDNNLIFDRIDAVSRQESYSDLWRFQLSTGKSHRLSKGLRAREPSPTLDGKQILFTGIDGAQTWLGVWDLASGKSRQIWKSESQERVTFPCDLGDGRIIFSLKRKNGDEALMTIGFNGGAPTAYLEGFPNARFPEVQNGHLTFTSSKNGVHNLYVAQIGQKKSPVPETHVLSNAFTSTTDPGTGDVYATLMTDQGPALHLIAKAEVDRISQAQRLPVTGGLFADRYPATAMKPDPNVETSTEEYSAGSYLWTHYWLPTFGVSAVNNSLLFEASTSGFDPLKRHVYSVLGTYDTGLSEPGYAVNYENHVWPVALDLASARTASYFVTPSNHVISSTASALLVPDLFNWSRFLTIGFGGDWARTDYLGIHATRWGATGVVEYIDYTKAGDQISPEDGGSLAFFAHDYLPGANQLSYKQYLAGGNFFFSKWLPERHALALRASGIYTPDPLGSIYGAETTNFFLQQDLPGVNFVMRGFRVGHFFGKSMGNAGAEYRFPISEIRRGSGTLPWYFLRVHGAVFADAVAVDGFAYQPSSGFLIPVSTDRIFTSAGLEARLESTIGYVIPLNFIFGYAVPSPRDFSDGPGAYTALQLGTIF